MKTRSPLYLSLIPLEVGQAVWMETTREHYADLQRRISSVNRYPAHIKDHRFACAVYTAVPAKLGTPRYIVRVERIK